MIYLPREYLSLYATNVHPRIFNTWNKINDEFGSATNKVIKVSFTEIRIDWTAILQANLNLV